MRILLPPSEKKRTPISTNVLNLSSLSFASELTQVRARLIDEHPALTSEPVDAAIMVYSGVLYQSLGWQSLKEEDRARARQSIVISSALFGALSVEDQIPNYKHKVKPGQWKAPLEAALADVEEDLIVDCRSSTYANMWKSNPHITVGMRVFELRKGERQVITHMAKKTRGEITRLLLQENSAPRNPEELFEVLKEKYEVDLVTPWHTRSWFIDVVVK